MEQPNHSFRQTGPQGSRAGSPRLSCVLSPHLLLGGELSDRETSGRAAVTVPADACGQRRIRSRTRKLPILPDRASPPCASSGSDEESDNEDDVENESDLLSPSSVIARLAAAQRRPYLRMRAVRVVTRHCFVGDQLHWELQSLHERPALFAHGEGELNTKVRQLAARVALVRVAYGLAEQPRHGHSKLPNDWTVRSAGANVSAKPKFERPEKH